MCKGQWFLVALGVLLSQVALLVWPVISNGATEVELDDIAAWGLKGPGLPSLTGNMRGIWYLSGNLEPSACLEEDMEDPKKCRNGFVRSSIMMIDSSYCDFDRPTGEIICGPKSFVCSKRKSSLLMHLTRAKYVVQKNDPEFIGRGADLFEGGMHLFMFGIALPDFPFIGNPYRVTGEDVNGDGSVIERFTWWGEDAYTPQEKTQHDKDWFYQMKRVVDGAGEIDQTVLDEIKSVYGDTVHVAWTI